MAMSRQDKQPKICSFYLRGICKYSSHHQRFRHCSSPYQWQIRDTIRPDWLDLTQEVNDDIEEKFCDVKNSEYSGAIVCMEDISRLVTITFGVESFSVSVSDWQNHGGKVTEHGIGRTRRKTGLSSRGQMHGSTVETQICRLSTSSSVLESNWDMAFCTEWIWYWQDETGKWIVYSEQNAEGMQAGIDSAAIEQKFLDYESKSREPVIEFTAGHQSYKLDFTAMQQTNVHYGTCRLVKRRPKFVTMTERKRLSRELSQAQTAGVVVSTTWDKRCTRTELKRITPMDANAEYTDIANLFWDTMDEKGTIVSIQRIQNMELWEDFSKMSERMKKKNSNQAVSQKQLFHGTTSSMDADAICRQNFDCRLSGTNVGTRYGKGIYFARYSVFAHYYTRADDLNHRYVFVAQVLLGTSTTGQSDYTRPPPRDTSNPHGDLYDSCVDDIADPNIFVVFEKTQVYPEYLITYKEMSSNQKTPARQTTNYLQTQPSARRNTPSARTTAFGLQPVTNTMNTYNTSSHATRSSTTTTIPPRTATSSSYSAAGSSATNPQNFYPSQQTTSPPQFPSQQTNILLSRLLYLCYLGCMFCNFLNPQ